MSVHQTIHGEESFNCLLTESSVGLFPTLVVISVSFAGMLLYQLGSTLAWIKMYIPQNLNTQTQQYTGSVLIWNSKQALHKHGVCSALIKLSTNPYIHHTLYMYIQPHTHTHTEFVNCKYPPFCYQTTYTCVGIPSEDKPSPESRCSMFWLCPTLSG